jgi:CRISPR-associated protein Cas2
LVVYDIDVKKLDKVRAILRRHLIRIQKSVFEGAISDSSLKTLKTEPSRSIKVDHDSIIFHQLDYFKSFDRVAMRIDLMDLGFII